MSEDPRNHTRQAIIFWDKFDPARDAFVFGRTNDRRYVEVYCYRDPADLRRKVYAVNIWAANDYTTGAPLDSFMGRGNMDDGKRAAQDFLIQPRRK